MIQRIKQILQSIKMSLNLRFMIAYIFSFHQIFSNVLVVFPEEKVEVTNYLQFDESVFDVVFTARGIVQFLERLDCAIIPCHVILACLFKPLVLTNSHLIFTYKALLRNIIILFTYLYHISCHTEQSTIP